jgi:rare lipoprotein A
MAVRAGVVALAAAFLASCSGAPTRYVTATKSNTKSKEYFSEQDYKVAASPRLVDEEESVPKGGGFYKIGKPYSVAGKIYTPKENPRYSAKGLASWYGGAFHGRLTANGEVYDMAAITAAHPTMPLPSYARVTNLDNSRSIIVRVNDRGPFAHNRIIDVSETVASMLDFKRAGTARVKVDYVGPADMDGHDKEMLLASYRATGGGDGPMLALNAHKPDRVFLASGKKPRRADTDRFAVFEDSAGPVDLVPASAKGDELGPLILRNSFASSYAPADRFSEAESAVADMASLSVVQLGAFGDAGNADRAAERFARFGKVVRTKVSLDGRLLTAVRIVVDGRETSAADIVVAARSDGLTDAYVISQ